MEELCTSVKKSRIAVVQRACARVNGMKLRRAEPHTPPLLLALMAVLAASESAASIRDPAPARDAVALTTQSYGAPREGGRGTMTAGAPRRGLAPQGAPGSSARPAPSGTPGAAAPEAAAGGKAPEPFTPLELPEWIALDPESEAKTRPWILVVDDPQCPYCMQLHLALEKSRELNDPEIARAVVARLPFPLAYHDQSAHIVSDAFCLEASRAGRPWSAASYLDWLIVAPWREEPEWKLVTLDEIGKEGGFFDAKYDRHRVTSSRRRDFQTERARAESACPPGACRGDAECEALCAAERTCREACPQEGSGADSGAAPGGATPAGSAASERQKCLTACSDRFVSARYRLFSKVHSSCLLEEGPQSAHGKTAAAFAWAVAHKVPGTPTVYVGHPRIGFRVLGDSDHLSDFLVLLRQALAEARARMDAVPGPA